MLSPTDKLAIAEKHLRNYHPTLDPRFNHGYGGTLIRRSFYGLWPKLRLPRRRNRLPLNEDLIEWVELCCAIEAARDHFTMAELGAGFGRWAVMGGVAARRAGLKPRLIAVEAERTHFAMLRRHFLDNCLDPDEHLLIEAAVTDSDRDVFFVHGHSAQWWGQAILPSRDYGYGDWPNAEAAPVKGLSLATILRNIASVDFVTMDVQGAEADVVRGSLDTIAEKVRRIHIGTHSREVEMELRALFGSIGFRCENDFPRHGACDTDFGTIAFEDGVQTWINPSFNDNY